MYTYTKSLIFSLIVPSYCILFAIIGFIYVEIARLIAKKDADPKKLPSFRSPLILILIAFFSFFGCLYLG